MENLKNRLSEELSQLGCIVRQIVNSEERIHTIERDLLMQKLRELYNIALQLDGDGPSLSDHNYYSTEAGPMPNEEEFLTARAEIDEMLNETPEPPVEPEPASSSANPNTVEPEPVADPQPIAEPAPEPKPVIEPEPVVETLPAEEMPLFAPEEEPVAETVVEPLMEAMEQDEIPFESPSPEPVKTPAPEPASEPAPAPIPEPELAKSPEPAKATETKQSSLFDYLRPSETPSHTLGDILGQNSSSLMGERMGQNRVTDLRTVITVNDKFSFMTELFHGNLKAYNDFIMELNGIDNEEVAMTRIAQVAQKQEWDSSSIVVSTFYQIVKRKF